MSDQIRRHSANVEDNISILSTSYYPDNGEWQGIGLHLKAQSEKIKCLEQTIQELCTKRDALQRTTAIGQSLLAPIQKLPAEILAEIFVHCMPDVHLPLDVNNTEFDLEHMTGIHNVAPFRHPTFIRLWLTQVSHK